jgi:hypothetical protein
MHKTNKVVQLQKLKEKINLIKLFQREEIHKQELLKKK